MTRTLSLKMNRKASAESCLVAIPRKTKWMDLRIYC